MKDPLPTPLRSVHEVPFGRLLVWAQWALSGIHTRAFTALLAAILLLDLCFPNVPLSRAVQQSVRFPYGPVLTAAASSEATAVTTEPDSPLSQVERETIGSLTPGDLKIQLAKKASVARARTAGVRYVPGVTYAIVATAYSSTPDQTDSDPCTTANGYNVCKYNKENVIAINGVPFGTRVRFPNHFGDRVFTVVDRMNSRYGSTRVDFWMQTRAKARQFGVRRLEMEVVDEQLALSL